MKKNKPSNHNTKILGAGNVLLTKTTVSHSLQGIHIFFGVWCRQQHSQPNTGFENKESIGFSVYEGKTELQSWAFLASEWNAGLTSWVMVYFGPAVPMLLNRAGKGAGSTASSKERGWNWKAVKNYWARHMALKDILHYHPKVQRSFTFKSKPRPECVKAPKF